MGRLFGIAEASGPFAAFFAGAGVGEACIIELNHEETVLYDLCCKYCASGCLQVEGDVAATAAIPLPETAPIIEEAVGSTETATNDPPPPRRRRRRQAPHPPPAGCFRIVDSAQQGLQVDGSSTVAADGQQARVGADGTIRLARPYRDANNPLAAFLGMEGMRFRPELALGYGVHDIRFGADVVRLLHCPVGAPLSTKAGSEQPRTILLRHGQRETLLRFCEALVAKERSLKDDVVRVFTFGEGGWAEATRKPARRPETVVLPGATSAELLGDLAQFAEDAEWYASHCIPYKRTYLFHGPPGTGKSSMIGVMAAEAGRCLCYLQPSALDDDEALRCAVASAPERSIVVLEDIDRLFQEDGKVAAAATGVTMAGILDAMDGACSGVDGHVFVITTNHLKRLDPALVRPGRVDVCVMFPSGTVAQARRLFLSFYPDHAGCAQSFAKQAARRFGTGAHHECKNAAEGDDSDDLLLLSVSMATLQKHFIACRKLSAEEAVERFAKFRPSREEMVANPHGGEEAPPSSMYC
jgi:DNA polymerase III delta prime subunit